MKIKIYAIFDAVAKAHLQPFFAFSDPLAARMFTQAVNDQKSTLWANPVDYTLFRVGEFDDETGILYPVAKPELVVSGAQVRARVSE